MRVARSEAEAAAQAAVDELRSAHAAAQAAREASVNAARVGAEERVASLEAHFVAEKQSSSAMSAEKVAQEHRLGAMSRMVREQQTELTEGYRFAAACKLSTLLERRVVISLSSGFGVWRLVCAALVLESSHADGRRKDKEIRAMTKLVSDLQTQIEVTRSRGPGSRPPLASSSSNSALKTTGSQRPLSPRPSLTEQLEGALASRLSPGRASPGRAASPPPSSLEQMLNDAVARRTQRSESLADDLSHACNHCGTTAERNFVRCSKCSTVYHIKCLTTSQAARFKGKGWSCDDCL